MIQPGKIITRAATLVCGVLLICTLWQCTPKNQTKTASAAGDKSFTILQINDVYRIEGIENGTLGGFGRIRTLRQELEAKDDVLFLHGGDLLFPSVMSRAFDAKTMIDGLNRLDGDADKFDDRLVVVFGNHEFDEDQPIFDARVRESDFLWLGTNLIYTQKEGGEKTPISNHFDQVLPHKIMDIAGLKVGIFGVTLDDYSAPYIGFDYDENINQRKIAALANSVAFLKTQKVDVLIALTHQTFEMDQRLVKDFPEIDLVIGGHEHIALQSDQGTSITKADADAITAWVIQVDASQPGKPKLKKTLRKLDSNIKKEPKIQAFVDDQVMRLSRKIPDYHTVYGSSQYKLEGLESEIRSRETAMGNWLADVARQRMNTDIAFLNGGGIRINDNIPAGSDIRGEHLAGIFYYAMGLVTFNLKGHELLDVLNNSVSMVDLGSGRFLQISGMKFQFRQADEAREGARFLVIPATVKILDRQGQWQPLDSNRSYSVTTTQYLWKNGIGDGYELFSKGQGGSSPPLTSKPGVTVDLRESIEALLKHEPVVTAQIDGRIGRRFPPKK